MTDAKRQTIAEMMLKADEAYKKGPPHFGAMMHKIFEDQESAWEYDIRQIEAMCGAPDPAEACWNILSYISVIRNEKLEES